MVSIGQEVVATRDATIVVGGYLNFRREDRLKVLYVGFSPEEAGWLYAETVGRKAGDGAGILPARKGWVSLQDVAAVDATSVGGVGSVKVKDVVKVVNAHQGLAEGFLSCEVGKILQVEHVGTCGDERGWIYAKGVEPGDQEGWLPINHVAACRRRAGKQRGKGRNNSSTLRWLRQCMPHGPPPPVPQQHGTGKGKRWPLPSCQPPPPPSRFRLVTFGLETEPDLYDQCARAGTKTGLAENSVRAACERNCGQLEDMQIVVLDGRMFPDLSSELQMHYGTHSRIVRLICDHDMFVEWLRMAKNAISQSLRPGQLAIIAVYCRSGKHCSVALAVVLEHILSRVGCLIAEEAEDISRREPFRTAKFCQLDCQECKEAPPELACICDAAFKTWRLL